MPIEVAKDTWREWLTCVAHGAHGGLVKCQKIALHPRTAALTEIAYATHGLLHGNSFAVYAVYGAILLVALAHLIWVHLD